MEVALAMLMALAGGAVGGLLGAGGGILFVPAMVILLGSGQVEAEATSLLVIVPMAMAGTWRQLRHGNVDVPSGVKLGLFSIPGVIAGVALANAVSERALELGFAALCVVIAARLIGRALLEGRPGPGTGGGAASPGEEG
ncbi:MAG: sulfite exporter TauE/SafE family protein [Solirubrobacterales bacterium]|nr:sulfite exporter TauE/SafE family protein [Solirubrobacterales bacterium]MCB1008622.1 sulfite exporter TauE/SafE family protein [Acidobacteriota bacterium]MCO5326277.1 sulfite exporter TauE/SafE family protein [Solirubrobacterales bacterium]